MRERSLRREPKLRTNSTPSSPIWIKTSQDSLSWPLAGYSRKTRGLFSPDSKIRCPHFAGTRNTRWSLRPAATWPSVLKGGDYFADYATAAIESVKKSLGEMADLNDEQLKQNTAAMFAATSSLIWTMWSCALIALPFGCYIAIFLSRKISHAASSALSQAEAIAAGDLSGEEVEQTSSDELGQL